LDRMGSGAGDVEGDRVWANIHVSGVDRLT
jgi:hypothetical protein